MVTMAPLLGLLGTVLGMIRAFNVLTLRSGQPLAITGGVAEALICTATGLTVAIITLPVYNYYNGRVRVFTSDMEICATDLLTVLDVEANPLALEMSHATPQA